MKRQFSLLAAAVATLFSVGGNLFAQDKSDADKKEDKAPVVSKDADFAERQLAFTLNLFHSALETESKKNSNTLIAPFSVYRSLAALSLGSAGKTKTEINAALYRSGWNDERWQKEFGAVDAALKDAPEATIAGGLWTAPHFQLRQEFAEGLKKLSGQEATSLDFKRPNANEDVNYWISDKTNGRIKDLVQPLDASTCLLLADATSFAGKWRQAFDPKETTEDVFFNRKNEKFKLPLMKQTGEFLFYETDDFQYLEAPYEDSRFSLVVVLPNKDKYADVESALTPDQLLECREEAQPTELEFRFPKFSVSRSFDLVACLKEAGVEQAFGLTANLSPIAGSTNLYVNSVTQGVYLAVDEAGTTAEAATVAVAAPKTRPRQFNVNRPFLYFVRHNADGAVLFVGRFVAPENAGGKKEESKEEEPKKENESNSGSGGGTVL